MPSPKTVDTSPKESFTHSYQARWLVNTKNHPPGKPGEWSRLPTSPKQVNLNYDFGTGRPMLEPFDRYSAELATSHKQKNHPPGKPGEWSRLPTSPKQVNLNYDFGTGRPMLDHSAR